MSKVEKEKRPEAKLKEVGTLNNFGQTKRSQNVEDIRDLKE